MTIYEALNAAIAAEQPVAVATIIGGAGTIGAKLLARPDGSTLGELDLISPGGGDLGRHARDAGARRKRHPPLPAPAGEAELFIESYPPPPTMFIVGAVHIAIPLVTFAKVLGFRTVVVDARGAFATPERFAHADEPGRAARRGARGPSEQQ